jgi:hypothetical protein
MKQVPYWEYKNIMRRRTKFSCHGDPARGICIIICATTTTTTTNNNKGSMGTGQVAPL